MSAKPSRNGLVASQGLSSADYTAITKLANICNEYDDITLKTNDFMLQSRSADETNDFLYFVEGELIGFLGVYPFNGREVEISGMVHPSHRRKGLFTALVSAARAEVAQRGISKFIFINAETSTSGKLFLASLGAKYEFSEYWMRHMDTKFPEKIHPIHLREANTTDLPFIAHLMAIGFHADETEELASMTNDVTGVEKSSTRHVIEHADTPIGAISINHPKEASAFFFGFVILPEYQGKGYGRQALALSIEIAQARNCTKIELEVACENRGALSLYRSCGFEVLRANDYYVVVEGH